MRDHFGGVRIESVNDDRNGDGGAHVGTTIRVEAAIDLAGLAPEDVTVQLYYGSLNEDGQIHDGTALPMEQVDQQDGRVVYAVQMPCARTGMTGYTVRVMPQHPMLTNSQDLSMIRWA